MKLRHLLLVVCLLLVSAFAFHQDESAKATKASFVNQPSFVLEGSNINAAQKAIDKSGELTAKWLNSLGTGNWLYISSKYEAGGELGIDPETGLPLPNRSLWESWYTLNSAGQQTTVLTRRTDLERGNVTYVAWQNDKLYRLPSGTLVDTSQQGNAWKNFRPLRDHACNTRLPEFLSSPIDSITKEISSKSLIDSGGVNQLVITMTTHHPPVSDVSGFPGTFKEEQFICYWNNDTGEIESTEQFLITDKGEPILLNRDYDYIVQWVTEPPIEMLDLLKQLDTGKSKP